MSVRSGSEPSHAARVSAKFFGAHCGAAGVNAANGNPAASKTLGHSGAAAGVASESTWGGT